MPATFSFSRSLRDQARVRPQAPALTLVAWHGGDHDRTALSYRQLDSLADRVAARLIADGAEPGDRVAVLCRNQLVQPAVMYGASRARAIPVTVNWRLSHTELRGVIADAEPRLLIATGEFAGAAEAVSDLVKVVVLDDSAAGPRLESWLGTDAAEPVELDNESADIAMLCYTSGTTGDPKGVITTNAQVRAHLDSNCYDYLTVGTTFLNTAPTFHAAGAGLVWAPLEVGSHVIMIDSNEIDAIVALLGEANAALLVPTVLQAVVASLRRAGRTLPDLESVVYGASPISAGALSSALELVPTARFYQTYGMTETTGPLTQLSPDDHQVPSRLDSAGSVRRGVELRILDPVTLEELPAGEVGEITARSAQLTSGYWRRPEETTALFTPDGWLRTGDLGCLDRDGFLHIKDRLKDMIVTGGENVYAVEVESVLSTFPGVEEACVIGVPDDHWGESVTAVVVGGQLDTDALIEHARERLAHYKCPRSVVVVDSLPKSPAGKVLRREVRDAHVA